MGVETLGAFLEVYLFLLCAQIECTLANRRHRCIPLLAWAVDSSSKNLHVKGGVQSHSQTEPFAKSLIHQQQKQQLCSNNCIDLPDRSRESIFNSSVALERGNELRRRYHVGKNLEEDGDETADEVENGGPNDNFCFLNRRSSTPTLRKSDMTLVNRGEERVHIILFL
ncbi:unnamed protein product [Protopolystoma xenopodis]|uniref:Uncharacterized protein n=1 Tax=Protopolystoma xenopodis TaxID=117903 RepID=A0A448X901_9PLAT|nr:unnamed protein product [Protopolystoma xenopodis]